jgi:hypothetical protein
MPVAKATAERQGYDGVRWPKMVGPDGRDSPSPIAPLLIWQQPHPIYYAELCYQRNPPGSDARASGRTSFSRRPILWPAMPLKENDRYVLGPPLKTVSENTDTLTPRKIRRSNWPTGDSDWPRRRPGVIAWN